MEQTGRLSILTLALLVTIAMIGSMLLTTGGRIALPLDDPYIYFQYAAQTAHGEFLRYNDGDPITTGATSLLYVLALTPFALVAKGTALLIVAMVGAAALFFLTLRSVYRIAGAWIGPESAWPTT